MAKILIVTVVTILTLLVMSQSKGLLNRYSLTLVIIMGLSICGGGIMVLNQNFWGILPILLGSILATGFRTIPGSNPRRVGLITFFGYRTGKTVEGLTLICDTPIDIISLTLFDMNIEDMDFDIESIRSWDGVRLKGKVSIGIQAKESELGKFDDAGRMTGIHKLLDENIVAWLQEIGREDKHDWRWMESQSSAIRLMLEEKLMAKFKDRDDDNNPILNAQGLGFTIRKIDVKLTPVNQSLIDADEKIQIENLQKVSEKTETDTINEQTKNRYAMYRDYAMREKKPLDSIPTLAQCRKEIIEDRVASQGNMKIIQGSPTINIEEDKKKG